MSANGLNNRHLFQNDKLKLEKLKEKLAQEVTHQKLIAAKIKSTTAETRCRPTKSRQIAQQIFKRYANLKHYLRPFSNYILTERHSSLIKLGSQDCKRISFGDMTLNKIHMNTYVECRTLEDPVYVGANVAHFLVNDDADNYENLVVYNCDQNVDMPSGTRLLIKEPHLQLNGLGEFDFAIRIDSPSNLVVIVDDGDGHLREK
jgi:hypothetical protein